MGGGWRESSIVSMDGDVQRDGVCVCARRKNIQRWDVSATHLQKCLLASDIHETLYLADRASTFPLASTPPEAEFPMGGEGRRARWPLKQEASGSRPSI